MTNDETIKQIEDIITGRREAFCSTEALTTAINALAKLEAIRKTTPKSCDWSTYADELYDLAYGRGVVNTLKAHGWKE